MPCFRSLCFACALLLALWCATGESTCMNGTCANLIHDNVALKQTSLRVYQHKQESVSAGGLESLLVHAKQQGEQGEALSAIVTRLATIPGGLSLLAVTGPKEICDQNAKMARNLKAESTAIEKKQLEEDQEMVDDQLKRLQFIAERLKLKKKVADDAALPMSKCLGRSACENISVGSNPNCTNDKYEEIKNSSQEVCRNASRDAKYRWGLNGSLCHAHECNFDLLDQCGDSKDAADFCPGLSELRKALEKIEKGISDAFEQYKCSMAKCEAAKDEFLKLIQICQQGKEDIDQQATLCKAMAGRFRAAACEYGEVLQIYRHERMRFDNISATAMKQELINAADWRSQMLMICQLESCSPDSGMIDPNAMPGCMEKVDYAQDIGSLSTRSDEIAALDAKWNYESCHLETFEKKEGNITMQWCGADEGEDPDVRYPAFPICRSSPYQLFDSWYGVIYDICTSSLQACTCSNGMPATKAPCTASRPEMCFSCNSGHHLTPDHTCDESR